MAKTNEIMLGAGTIYCMEATEEMPVTETLFGVGNKLAETSGGCSITYTPTYYEAKSDYSDDQQVVMTDDEAVFKFGVCKFNDEVLKKLVATAKDSSGSGENYLDLGGVANDNHKSYFFGFEHKDKNVMVVVKGKNTAVLEMAFAKDKEVVLTAEVKCEKMANGHKVRKITKTA